MRINGFFASPEQLQIWAVALISSQHTWLKRFPCAFWIVSVDHTCYYHCTSRCVRQAFLCGKDKFSGRDFEHRRDWLERRLVLLAGVFAIELLAYAIMANHYHVVIQLKPDRALHWSDDEVVRRWKQLYPKAAYVDDAAVVAIWRNRLCNLSWYMRAINEPLARMSNREDDCKGRFWEGRFRSQALLDESALMKCMAYVDLNPVRAGLAVTPEESEHTSIKARIDRKDDHLVSFKSGTESGLSHMELHDYLKLVDWTGRAIRSDKRGYIPINAPPIAARLVGSEGRWIQEIKCYGHWYYRAVGSLCAMKALCEQLGQQWLKGMGKTARSYSQYLPD